MKTIAVMETHDWEGGTRIWLKNLVHGLNAKPGLEVYVIKSPRQKLFCHPNHAMELVAKDEKDVFKYLDEIQPDLVLIQSAYDTQKQTMKFPMWQEAIESLQWPYTFAVHDHAQSYLEPFGREILERTYENPNFLQAVVSVSHLPPSLIEAKGHKRVISLLPYGYDYSMTGSLTPSTGTLRVGAFSHVSKVKQWSILFRSAVIHDEAQRLIQPHEQRRMEFSLFGGCASSPDLSATAKMAVFLQETAGMQPDDYFFMSDVHKALPWSGTLTNGTRVHYNGKFDASNVLSKMATNHVFLNTTQRCGGSSGPIEYTSMEAINAGVVPLVPQRNAVTYEHLNPLTYRVVDYPKPQTTPSIMKMKRHDVAAFDINHQLNDLHVSTTSRSERRSALIAQHDPQVVAEKLVKDLGL